MLFYQGVISCCHIFEGDVASSVYTTVFQFTLNLSRSFPVVIDAIIVHAG